MSRPELDSITTETGVIAILRGGTGEHLVPVAEALVAAGVRSLEITTNTAGYPNALRALRNSHGDSVSLGLGTVRTVADVEAAAKLDVDFVVAPGTDAGVAKAAIASGLRWLPGAFTPTEIERAWSLGATAVKVFPADHAGGPAYLRAVRAPLDDIALIPTGGVGIDAIGDYLSAGAVAVGLGSPLIGDSLRTGTSAGLVERATEALTAVAQERGTT